MKGGFKESPLKLNAGLGQLEKWDEDAIKARAGKLAGEAVEVWKSPKLSSGVLDAYQAKVSAAGYTIQDHPYLLASPMRELFEAFRKEVLALDPCVYRGVPQALRRLQGGDQLRGCRASGQTTAALPQHRLS